MNTERHADLQQQCYEKKESIWRLEEEIRELEAKIDIPKEANETSEPIKDKVVSGAKETSTPKSISDPDVYTGTLIQSWGKTKSTFMEGSHLFFLRRRISRSGEY